MSWSQLALRYIVVGFLLGLLVALLYEGGAQRTAYATFPLVLAIAAPAAGLLLRRVFSGRIAGRFVALTPGGIVVGTRPRPLTIGWADFERLHEHRGVLRVHRRGDAPPVALEDVFPTPEAVADFRAAVQAATRRSPPAPDDSTFPPNPAQATG